MVLGVWHGQRPELHVELVAVVVVLHPGKPRLRDEDLPPVLFAGLACLLAPELPPQPHGADCGEHGDCDEEDDHHFVQIRWNLMCAALSMSWSSTSAWHIEQVTALGTRLDTKWMGVTTEREASRYAPWRTFSSVPPSTILVRATWTWLSECSW